MMSTAALTLENVNNVKSMALKRIFMEQIQIQESRAGTTDADAWTDHTKHDKSSDCICVIGGV